MDGDLGRLVADQRGFFFRWQALDCGYGEREVAQRLRAGEWVAIRRGAYAERSTVEGLDAAGRHVLTVRAAVHNLDGLVVVSHASALAVLGVPLWGVDFGTVHVHRESGRSSRTEAGVVHHRGELGSEELIEVDGLLVTVPERAVIDAARRESFEAGVVLADGALRELSFDMNRAREIVERQRDWAGSGKAERVLRFSDGAAATVGESRSRVMMARIGLPKPQLQRPYFRRDGSVFAHVDFYIEEYDTAGEFDGKQKYGRAFYERTGRLVPVDLGDVLWQEKRREDDIREHGSEVVRWVWFELDGHDAGLRARFQRAFARNGRRRQAS